jgi:DNA-binding NarL/FixJ family response regulator
MNLTKKEREMAAALAKTSLSPREVVVFWALGQGGTYEDMAKRLGRSLKTLQNQADNARRKMKFGNGVEAAVWACRLGLLDLSEERLKAVIGAAMARREADERKAA